MVKIWTVGHKETTLVILTIMPLFFIMCTVWWSRCGDGTDRYAPIFYHVHCVMVKVWWWHWSLCPYFLSCALCDGQDVVKIWTVRHKETTLVILTIMPLFFYHVHCVVKVWWKFEQSWTQMHYPRGTAHYAPIFNHGHCLMVKIWWKFEQSRTQKGITLVIMTVLFPVFIMCIVW